MDRSDIDADIDNPSSSDLDSHLDSLIKDICDDDRVSICCSQQVIRHEERGPTVIYTPSPENQNDLIPFDHLTEDNHILHLYSNSNDGEIVDDEPFVEECNSRRIHSHSQNEVIQFITQTVSSSHHQLLLQIRDKTTEVTDKISKVTDKTMKVTDKTTEVTDKISKVTDKTMKVTDKTTNLTDKTKKVTDKTTKVTDALEFRNERKHSYPFTDLAPDQGFYPSSSWPTYKTMKITDKTTKAIDKTTKVRDSLEFKNERKHSYPFPDLAPDQGFYPSSSWPTDSSKLRKLNHMSLSKEAEIDKPCQFNSKLLENEEYKTQSQDLFLEEMETLPKLSCYGKEKIADVVSESLHCKINIVTNASQNVCDACLSQESLFDDFETVTRVPDELASVRDSTQNGALSTTVAPVLHFNCAASSQASVLSSCSKEEASFRVQALDSFHLNMPLVTEGAASPVSTLMATELPSQTGANYSCSGAPQTLQELAQIPEHVLQVSYGACCHIEGARQVKIPLIEEAQLPLIEEAQLPLIEEAQLPLIEEAQLPLIEEAQLPLIEEAQLPLIEEAQLPLIEEAQLPLIEEAQLPLIEEARQSHLPLVEEAHLPLIEEAQLPLIEEAQLHLIEEARQSHSPLIEEAQLPLIEEAQLPLIEEARQSHLPVIEEAQLPLIEEAQLPLIGEAQLPVIEEAQLPLIEKAQLPVIEEAQLPVIEEAQLPLIEEAQLPLLEEAQLPLIEEAQLPLIEEAQLPLLEEAQPPLIEEARHSQIPLTEEAQLPLIEEAQLPLIEEAQLPLIEEAQLPLIEEAQLPLTEEAQLPLIEEAQLPLIEEAQLPLLEEAQPPLIEEARHSQIPLTEEARHNQIHLIEETTQAELPLIEEADERQMKEQTFQSNFLEVPCRKIQSKPIKNVLDSPYALQSSHLVGIVPQHSETVNKSVCLRKDVTFLGETIMIKSNEGSSENVCESSHTLKTISALDTQPEFVIPACDRGAPISQQHHYKTLVSDIRTLDCEYQEMPISPPVLINMDGVPYLLPSSDHIVPQYEITLPGEITYSSNDVDNRTVVTDGVDNSTVVTDVTGVIDVTGVTDGVDNNTGVIDVTGVTDGVDNNTGVIDVTRVIDGVDNNTGVTDGVGSSTGVTDGDNTCQGSKQTVLPSVQESHSTANPTESVDINEAVSNQKITSPCTSCHGDSSTRIHLNISSDLHESQETAAESSANNLLLYSLENQAHSHRGKGTSLTPLEDTVTCEEQKVPEAEMFQDLSLNEISMYSDTPEDNHGDLKCRKQMKQVFQWNSVYETAMNKSLTDQPSDSVLDGLSAIVPIVTSHRPRRVGLSRKQKVKRLHNKP